MKIFNRRQFLQSSAGALAAPTLSANGQLKTSGFGKAKSVIYLYMGGGLSHLDSFDIKPENSEVRGEAGALKTSASGVRVSKFFPLLAKQMHQVAVVNSLSSTQGAHDHGTYFMHTSYTKRGTVEHPDLGAWVSKYLPKLNPTLPTFVKIGGGRSSLGAGFFKGKYGALPIGDPSSGLKNSVKPSAVSQDQFDRRLSILGKVNSGFAMKYKHKLIKSYDDAYKDAVKLMSSKDLKTFDLSRESEKSRDAYGTSSFGKGCLLARRLVQKGVRFVEVHSGDWDHHGKIYEDFPTKARELDQSLSALLIDLQQRGLLESTMVVVATEFGRSPVPNSNGGRNHYPKAFSGLLAGGGIQGGQCYGKTDKSGANVIENKVQVEDLNATIAHAIGLDINKEVLAANGRPFKVTHKGKPLSSLF